MCLQDLDTVVPGVDDDETSLLVEFHAAWTVKFTVFLASLSVLSVVAEKELY